MKKSVKRNKKWLIVVVLLNYSFLLFSAIASMNLTRFPGERSEILSPNRRFILYNIDTENTWPNHALFLKDIKEEKEKKLYAYQRYVEVLWSPQSTALFINDHGGSDYSNSIIFIFEGKKKNKTFDLREELRQNLGNHKSIFGNHHVYIESVEWLNEDKVKVKISGYGDVDPDGFTLWYEYKIGEGFRKLN